MKTRMKTSGTKTTKTKTRKYLCVCLWFSIIYIKKQVSLCVSLSLFLSYLRVSLYFTISNRGTDLLFSAMAQIVPSSSTKACRKYRRKLEAARSDSVVAFAASQEFEVADYTSFEEALEEEAYHRTCFAFAFEEAVAVVVVAVVACILLLASYAVVGGIAVAARLLP